MMPIPGLAEDMNNADSNASLKGIALNPNAARGCNQNVRQAFQPDLVSLERLTYNMCMPSAHATE
jgi:hypothetical protein